MTNLPKGIVQSAFTKFNKINSLLRDRGLVLNHAIARRAKATKRQARKIRPERKFLLKYIFPGSELIPVGTTTDTLENTGFEVHDVESLREHYALTLKYWSKNLTANKDEAIRLVGPEKYRLWAAYMTGGNSLIEAGLKSLNLPTFDNFSRTLFFTLLLGGFVFIGAKLVDYCNRGLMFLKLIAFLFILFFFTPYIKTSLLETHPESFKSFLFANHIINETPITGINVLIEG